MSVNRYEPVAWRLAHQAEWMESFAWAFTVDADSVTPMHEPLYSAETVAALEAEVAGLRKALSSIKQTKPVFGMNPEASISAPNSTKFAWNVHLIARAALTQPEQDDG